MSIENVVTIFNRDTAVQLEVATMAEVEPTQYEELVTSTYSNLLGVDAPSEARVGFWVDYLSGNLETLDQLSPEEFVAEFINLARTDEAQPEAQLQANVAALAAVEAAATSEDVTLAELKVAADSTVEDGGEAPSDLTEVLNALREAAADEDAALEAFARATLEADATQAMVDERKAALDDAIENDNVTEYLAANDIVNVEEAAAAVQQAIANLATARAEKSDAALQRELTAAQRAVNEDEQARALQNELNAARNDLVSDRNVNGADQDVAANLYNALIAFQQAGGTYDVNAFANFIDAYEAQLQLPASQQNWQSLMNFTGFANEDGNYTGPQLSGANADLRVAVREATVTIENRSELVAEVAAAETAFVEDTGAVAAQPAELVIDLADVLEAGVDPSTEWSAAGTLTVNGVAVDLTGTYADLEAFLATANEALGDNGEASFDAENGAIVITTTATGGDASLALSDFAITQEGVEGAVNEFATGSGRDNGVAAQPSPASFAIDVDTLETTGLDVTAGVFTLTVGTTTTSYDATEFAGTTLEDLVAFINGQDGISAALDNEATPTAIDVTSDEVGADVSFEVTTSIEITDAATSGPNTTSTATGSEVDGAADGIPEVDPVAAINLGAIEVAGDGTGSLTFQTGGLSIGRATSDNLSTTYNLGVVPGEVSFTLDTNIPAISDLNAAIDSAIISAEVDGEGAPTGNYILTVTGDGNFDAGADALAWTELAFTQAADAVTVPVADGDVVGGDGETSLGQELVAAEQAVEGRQELIEAVADAEADLADAEAFFAELQALLADVNAAADRVDALVEQLETEYGIENLISLGADNSAGTDGEGDLYIFTEDTGSISLTNFEADDILFIGSEFARVDLEAGVDITDTRQGDAGTLEVFFQQDGANLNIFIEQFEGAGSSRSDAELVQITLNGVNVDDVNFQNGFISIVEAA